VKLGNVIKGSAIHLVDEGYGMGARPQVVLEQPTGTGTKTIQP
jgi:hypothetical protein